MHSIELNGGHFMLIDEEDYSEITRHKWYARTSRTRTYAVGRTKGVRRMYAHRLIMKACAGQLIDHVNGNGLDNRRENLRFATTAQNCCNAKNRKGRTLPYRGVKLNKPDGSYHARISIRGVLKHLGSFSTAEDAARAFDLAAVTHRGAFAVLNFPAQSGGKS